MEGQSAIESAQTDHALAVQNILANKEATGEIPTNPSLFEAWRGHQDLDFCFLMVVVRGPSKLTLQNVLSAVT